MRTTNDAVHWFTFYLVAFLVGVTIAVRIAQNRDSARLHKIEQRLLQLEEDGK